MKCAESYPDGSYQECQLDLGHRGDHEYVGIKWARLEPAEPNEAVAELLENSIPARVYGVNERSYPVLVEATTTYVVWVDAETEDDALAYWADDPTDLRLDGLTAIDGSLEIQRLDRWQRQDAFRSRQQQQGIGPRIACPDCGALAMLREWHHKPLRKCHGPIEWRETRSDCLEWRYRREFKPAAPVHAARKQVAS